MSICINTRFYGKYIIKDKIYYNGNDIIGVKVFVLDKNRKMRDIPEASNFEELEYVYQGNKSHYENGWGLCE